VSWARGRYARWVTGPWRGARCIAGPGPVRAVGHGPVAWGALYRGPGASRAAVSVIAYARMALAPQPDLYDPTAVGPRVRALRDAMGLSLRELALRCGVSSAMLSQVERGETSPTLAVASRIAAGLDLRLSQLLRLDEGGSVTIVHADERRVGGNARRGHRAEVLTAPLPGQRAELSLHTLAPGAVTGGSDDPPMHEPGSRETALVQAGEVVLLCDGRPYPLAAGDCVTFDADLPHHFENHGPGEARLLAVVSAGLRRS